MYKCNTGRYSKAAEAASESHVTLVCRRSLWRRTFSDRRC